MSSFCVIKGKRFREIVCYLVVCVCDDLID